MESLAVSGKDSVAHRSSDGQIRCQGRTYDVVVLIWEFLVIRVDASCC